MEDQDMGINQAYFIKSAEEYIERWKCVPDGNVFFTHSSLLWPVRRGEHFLMLKITKPDDDEAHAAEFLKIFDGHGVIKLLEYEENAMLLERLEDKDSSLEEMVLQGKDHQATHIICDVIDRLHILSPQKKDVPFLTNFENRFESMMGYVERGKVPKQYKADFKCAYDILFDITGQIGITFRALHGDIHHFNILKSDNEEWLSIDPKGFWGPRVYEYATSLCTPPLYTDIITNKNIMCCRLQIMSERSGIEKELISTFGFIHAMQVAAWCSWSKKDQDFWLESARIAAKLAGIKLSGE